MTSFEIQSIASAVIPQLECILPNILPGGRLSGREYTCADLSGGTGESCKVNVTSGKWSDFATGESGGDPVSLLAAIRGASQSEAAAELSLILGHTTGNAELKRRAYKETWTAINPVPTDAPPPPKHYRYGEAKAVYEYRNSSGLNQIIQRYEFTPEEEGKKPKKIFVPLTYCINDSGIYGWKWQSLPDHRPLYGLELLIDSVKFAVIVEGEKACEAARRILGDRMPVLTWSGGSNAVHKTDWTPVKGLCLVVWPDADEAGYKAALAVADAVNKVSSEAVKIVVPPNNVVEGFDLADAEADSWTRETILQYLKAGVTAEEFMQIKAASAVSKITENMGEEPEKEQATEAPSIEQSRFARKSFPFEILPEPFGRLVTEYALALQVLPEIMAMCMLTIASGAIGNSIVLQIKQGWETVCFLWYALIQASGSGKSHAIEAFMQPVKEQQGREAARHKKLMDEYNLALAAYKHNKKDNQPPIEPPAMRHYYTTNFTIESLIPMYQACARSLIIFVDELAGLMKGFNQYKSGGNDQEQILSLFNAGDIKADRKSGGGYVRNSGAAVIGGIQHGIMSRVFGEADYINGTVYRFLPQMIDATPPRFTMDSISEEAAATWRNFIDWTYQIPLETDPESGKLEPFKLTLDPDGLEAWRIFHDRYAESQPFVSPKFAGYLPKLRTYCLKFMTILHVMECYRHDTLAMVVSVDTVNRSVLLAEYFAGQALQLIRGATEEQNPYHIHLRTALESLQSEVTGGRLLLSRIRERMNELLPGDMQIEATQNKRLATWLKDIGLTVAEGAQHKRYLVWESDKIFS